MRYFVSLALFLSFSPATWGAVAWQTGAGFRSANLHVPASGKTGFTELDLAVTGITFTNHLSNETAGANQILLNGSGVAAGDVDGDGRCDLYFCGLEGPNVLYRNLGDWKFADITASAGVDCTGQFSTGVVFADLDGDGDLDLLVNSVGGGTRCFRNDGKARFTEDGNAGLVRKFGSTSMALADIDGDGDLDLYVANYRTTTVRSTGFELLNLNGRRMVRPEDRERLYFTPEGFIREHGEVDVVYLNDGKGQFQPMSWTDGRFRDENGQPLADPPRDWALSVMFRDMNGDAAPDIYVCNDFWSPDKVWINDGQGNFRAIARTALANTSTFSMGMDFADINRDGLDDFMVLDMLSPVHIRRVTQTILFGLMPWPIGFSPERPQVTRNTLFLNRGDLTFAEIAQMSGVHATDWSWCPIFLDVDLDGYEDLLVANGNLFDTQDQDAEARINALGPWPRQKLPQKLLQYPPLLIPNMAFRNGGDLTFKECGATWGFATTGVSQGMCLADLDGDGDEDVVANNLNSAAGIHRNDGIAPRIAIRLEGAPPNTRGTGAKIWLSGGAAPKQSQEIITGGRYLSCDDPMRVFAAGGLTNRMTIEVAWRSGKRSVVANAEANRIYEIPEAEASVGQAQMPALRSPLFEDVSSLLQHVHHQEPFDDFVRQPLLPNKLSQPGPGVSWLDFDGDGWDDLVIGAGRGGRMGAFRNTGLGGFSNLTQSVLSRPITRGQTTVLGWRNSAGRSVLLAGSSNYEDGLPLGASVREFDLGKNTVDESLPGSISSTGPLALADIDGDGDLDLFVGGRVVPGRYPEPASSKLFRNDKGTLRLDAESSKILEKVGLVSGAVFSDLEGDGFPELLLACEWGPIRIFRNARGKLAPWNPEIRLLNDPPTARSGTAMRPGSRQSENPQPSTLNQLTGWWNGITTGDLDGDGRMDIVASNWGRNSKYESHRVQPLRTYYGDLNGAGLVDVVEAHFDRAMGRIVPERAFGSMANALPFIRERFTSHKAYGEASLAEVLGDRLKVAQVLEANTLESMILLNRGDRFEAKAMPAEAQFSPAFGVCIGDANGDGNEDVFLSQNFIATQPSTSPYDAGRGLWLKGDGSGRLDAIGGEASGVKVDGEGRGCALADFDGDGRVDLVVTQNGAETKLFRNIGARPGLRVRLNGPPMNPAGLGAIIRLRFQKRHGPAREIHGGAGYWSQDSARPVLAMIEPASHIEVRWPGGRTTTNAVPRGSREVHVSVSGQQESPAESR